jgi:hypothetical protein
MRTKAMRMPVNILETKVDIINPPIFIQVASESMSEKGKSKTRKIDAGSFGLMQTPGIASFPVVYMLISSRGPKIASWKKFV